MRNKMIYEERQSFLTWWLCLLLVIIFAGAFYAALANADTDGKEGFLTGMNWGLIVALLVLLLIFFVQLRSRVDADGIHVRFFPLMWKDKTWRWEDLGEVYVKKYSPWEYGGWGYRRRGAGTVYSTKGNYGIQLVLKKNGQHILIGTQRPAEVQQILASFKSKDHEA